MAIGAVLARCPYTWRWSLNTSTVFNRPGVSDGFLSSAGCSHVGETECLRSFGFRAEGIAIPFCTLGGKPVLDNGKPFVRIRLYNSTEAQKYHQRNGSGTHIYVPHNFRELPRNATLILTEGEFKSMALAEAGFCALGLCGISGAMRTVEGEPKLHGELAEALEFHKPARLLFLGDSDAVLNADFAREVTKLRKALFASKRFQFLDELRVAVCPLNGPKGVDDVRGAMGDEFSVWFKSWVDSAFIFPPKALPLEVFCALLRREIERVKTAITGDSHEAHRNLVKLLQSAGRLKGETGAMLKIKPLLAELLNVKESAIATMIRDAGQPTAEDMPTGKPANGAVSLRNVEPWLEPVCGNALLKEIVAFYEKFVVLPTHASTVLALWALQSWCYELFDFAAIIAVWSPEPECGKGRVLDVTEKLVRRPFRTSNTSAAVLYHVISKGNLTVLVDELDSISDEQRDAICNILKGGFQANGTAHRMTERNGEQVEIEFSTFCPKMIATITLDRLDKATRSRTIGIRMHRKLRSRKVAKFRRVDGTSFQRKCMRWAQDNSDAIKAVPPMDVDECASDRQEDVWEPLIAIARIVGADWETLLRRAAKELTNVPSDGASETLSHQLLAAFAEYFAANGDRVSTKGILAALNDGGDFADANYGRGLTPHLVAKLLKPYGIESRTIKLPDGSTAKGYTREWFSDAFNTYLSQTQVSKGNSVTMPVNTGESPDPGKVTKGDGYLSESAALTNKDGPSDAVTFSEPEKVETEQSALDL